jgi:hypothetical protein
VCSSGRRAPKLVSTVDGEEVLISDQISLAVLPACERADDRIGQRVGGDNVDTAGDRI